MYPYLHGVFASAEKGDILPIVGPYSDNAPQYINKLTIVGQSSDITWSNGQNLYSPLAYRTISFQSGTSFPNHDMTDGLFFWANEITMPGSTGTPAISTNGLNGNDGFRCGCVPDGAGGYGGGGGGGGGSNGCFPCDVAAGGMGGSGTDGFAGYRGGSGGLGFGSSNKGGYLSYGSGGNGGAGGDISCCCNNEGGLGDNGYSGGGGGGQAGPDPSPAVGGGGGGGGGLLVIVANKITGIGKITSNGGNGGNPLGAAASGGGGGGGCIWVAAKKYDGGLTTEVLGGSGANSGANGTARIFEINHDGTLGVQKLFTDTWDNL